MYDTIAALATPPMQGAIGIIRLSGDRAISIAAQVFAAHDGLDLSDFASRCLVRGQLIDGAGRTLDSAMAVVFRAPGSYTGEDVVEFHCHGSPALLSEALRVIYDNGARPARPGEFTKRAFLHGRMDLTQAEAVVDLVSAETADAARHAAGQVEGVMSAALGRSYDALTALCARFHAAVDFPDDAIEPDTRADMAAALRAVAGELTALHGTYERGRILREGVRVAILGRPNVGKSSLLNALLGYERAIVTALPGTTRDTLTESAHLGGVWLKLTDTAGLRETPDEIERQGVARARDAAKNAGLIFLVIDGSQELTDDDRAVMDLARGVPSIVLLNKSDLPRRADLDLLEAAFLYVCPVSAKTGAGLDALSSMVRRMFETNALPYDGGVLTNLRHAEAVLRASKSAALSAGALEAGLTPDAALMDAEQALEALGEITGKLISEEIIKTIFDRFCVGK